MRRFLCFFGFHDLVRIKSYDIFCRVLYDCHEIWECERCGVWLPTNFPVDDGD
ncbi:hypothetical protein LCGC14_0140690 [marine sediment metagenome]|uniref:Uncharacterized protein n=1 Tax=marine sediment metagenome TaxID=412755 RepID=A0A0F9Y2F1_9ZZZZ